MSKRPLTTLPLLLAVPAGIHFAVIGEHFEESVLFGAFFAFVGAAQLVLAARIASRPTRRRVAGSVLMNAALVGIWVISRTIGVPIGPGAGQAEAIILSDAVVAGLEIVAIVLGVRLLGHLPARTRTPLTTNRPALSRPRATALLAAALAGLAFTSVAQPAGAHRHAGEAHAETHSPSEQPHSHDRPL